MTYEDAKALALAQGFTHTAPLDVATVSLKSQVRDMCRTGCRQYAKRWSCPPGCGSLEELDKKIKAFSRGILVQTVAQLADEFDAEAMQQAESRHKAHFQALAQAFRQQLPDCLPLGAGCCRICSQCTYPEETCRFPQKMIVSMEAAGMLVMEICQKNDLAYYYGPNTIAYTSAILF